MSDPPSDGLGVDRIALTEIHFDRRVWPRHGLDDDRVALFASLYAEQGPSALPAIEVVDPKLLLLCDGVTRVSAARVAGLAELPTIVLRVREGDDPYTFAFLRAIQASTRGHKELTRAERQSAIRRLIAETELGDQEIAHLVGVSKATVWRQRKPSDASTEKEAADLGELYIATVAATEVATRIFRGIAKVYEARGLGLWDALTGDHTGERLARILANAFGEKAIEQAYRFRGWFDDAIATLDPEAER